MTGQNLTVRRLRWREPGRNRGAARQRLELALEDGGNRSALRPEAILCVRRIVTSLPDLDRLSNVLDAEIRDAARPACGIVPANANAVLFADRAELLACLARDWSAANFRTGWWWPVLFPRDDFTALVRRWLADAAAVPAALTRLDVAGYATPFLRKLAPNDLDALWRQVVRTFGLTELERTWSSIDLTNAIAAAPVANRHGAPWTPWVTPDASLSSKATRLLVTALMLERAPAKVCSHAFARAVAAWSEGNNGPQGRSISSRNKTPPSSGDTFTTPAPRKKVRAQGPETVLRQPLGREIEEPSDADEETGPFPAGPSEAPPSITRAPGTPARREVFVSASAQLDRGREETPEAGLRPAPHGGTGETALLPAAPQLDRIATEWGGVLYLVNLAIAAGLYPDFTAPKQPGLALLLWDFLALLGERMIGDKFFGDPLPGLLARLACRAVEDRPGAEFDPPNGESLEEWVMRIAEEFEERVRHSIGSEAEPNFRELMLKHGAKIEASTTRLDAYFSLAAHPIALRMAGFDRDPGWVPAGGRVIYFHYD